MDWRAYYTDGSYHRWQKQDNATYESVVQIFPDHRKRFFWVLHRIGAPSLFKGKDLLEVACNTGKNFYWLFEKFGQVSARSCMFDINTEVIKWAKEHNTKWKIDLFVGELQSISLQSESFDFIFCLDTIEHLEDHVYKGMIKELYRILRVNGQVLFFIGRGGSYSHIHKIPDAEAVEDFKKEGFRVLDRHPWGRTGLSSFWRMRK